MNAQQYSRATRKTLILHNLECIQQIEDDPKASKLLIFTVTVISDSQLFHSLVAIGGHRWHQLQYTPRM